jgi:hypothetical protein
LELTALDRGELADLYALYCRTIDGGDASGWVDCFAPDAVYDRTVGDETTVVRGREDLLAFAHTVVARRDGNSLHLTTNLVLEVDDAGIRGTCVMPVLDLSSPGQPAIASVGVYEDRLQRLGERWRFASRTVVAR